MKYLPIIAVAAIATLAIPSRALATDINGAKHQYHGSDCKVFGATAWTDLAFSGFGVKNLAASARNIICPLTKESTTPWDGGSGFLNYGRVSVHAEATSINAAVTCTVYVTGNSSSTLANSYAHTFGVIPAGTIAVGGMSALQSTDLSGDNDKAYMLCTLGPQARLVGYYLYEGTIKDPTGTNP